MMFFRRSDYFNEEHESDDDDSTKRQSTSQRCLKGSIPVSSRARAKRASKKTWRSKIASKRVAKQVSGIQNRRKRRMN